jgi:hypothetical protein
MQVKQQNNLVRSSALMLLLKSRPEIKPGSLNDHQSAALMFNIHLLVLSKRQCRNMCVMSGAGHVFLFAIARGGCKTYNSIVRGDPESRHANCTRPDCDLRGPREEKKRSRWRSTISRESETHFISFCSPHLAIWNGHLSLLERVSVTLDYFPAFI